MFKLFDLFLLGYHYNGLKAFIPFIGSYKLTKKNGKLQVSKNGKVVVSFKKVHTFVGKKKYIGKDCNNVPVCVSVKHLFID